MQTNDLEESYFARRAGPVDGTGIRFIEDLMSTIDAIDLATVPTAELGREGRRSSSSTSTCRG